uniref:Spliceosome-associated protein CWC27 homolog n=2 Tax=Cacopsylla melanoneura TaxID=428564 RepID=A0A8D8PN49_9HEMI
MSNIYIQEPPTEGKVLLKTSVGDIDIELWSRETPKACRNFVQLCMEGYYNNTIIHRIVKGFIAQGGDPTGTGTGGDSIYGKPFKDEIHSRLRFVRRGLVAMANAGKDDNGSQFFFTLASTPELNAKHTIFGKVAGDTIYNMIKLDEVMVDHDDRPLYDQKIIKAVVLSNPFPDIIPRVSIDSQSESGGQEKRPKSKSKAVKNFKLLSFGEEAEEDEEEVEQVNQKFSGKSKSTHDVLQDPKLSNVPAVEKSNKESSESDLSGDERHGHASAGSAIDVVKNKLKLKSEKSDKTNDKNAEESDKEEEGYDFYTERRKEKQKRLDDLKNEYQSLKANMKQDSKKKKSDQEKERLENEEREKKKEEQKKNEDYFNEIDKYKQKVQQIPKKGKVQLLVSTSREDNLVAMEVGCSVYGVPVSAL